LQIGDTKADIVHHFPRLPLPKTHLLPYQPVQYGNFGLLRIYRRWGRGI
jgi:hypothetical protein